MGVIQAEWGGRACVCVCNTQQLDWLWEGGEGRDKPYVRSQKTWMVEKKGA